LDGAPATVFSRPSDIVPVKGGYILVLDAGASDVRSFEERGRYMGMIVSHGLGPSELVNPVGIDVFDAPARVSGSSPQRLVVGTRSHVKVFALKDNEIALERTLGPPEIPLPDDVCTTGSRIAVRAGLADGGALVAVIDSSGRKVAAFGEGYQYGGSNARAVLSGGRVGCLPNGDVVLAFTYLPFVRAYDANGGLRWSAVLPDFKPLAFREVQRRRGVAPGFISSYDHAGHMVLSIVPLGGAGVLVQVAELAASTPENPRVQKIERWMTYLLSTATGEGALVSERLPGLMAANDSTLWTVEEAAAGHLVVVAYRY
jgi:hypothetical protein